MSIYDITAECLNFWQWAAVIYPVLAPLPVTRSAAALGFFSFCRSFAQVSHS